RPRSGDALAVVHLDLDVFKSDNVKLVANEFLRQAPRLDDCLHMCLDPFTRSQKLEVRMKTRPRRPLFILTPDSWLLTSDFSLLASHSHPVAVLAPGVLVDDQR